MFYRNLNNIINQQRMRDRSLKAQQERQTNEMRKRNQKILETVSQHFPEIEILTRYEKHREAIVKLAKPRASSAKSRASSKLQ